MRDWPGYRSTFAIFLGCMPAACGESDQGVLAPGSPMVTEAIEVPGRTPGVTGSVERVEPPALTLVPPAPLPVAQTDPETGELPLPDGEGFGQGLVLGLAEAELCAELQRDRTSQNEIALNRLELLFSRARIEASVGQPVATDGYYFAAPIEVERVWFGPSFVEGLQTYLALSPAQAESFVPGRYLIGTASGFPGHELATGAPTWVAQALIPVAQRDAYADLFAFTVQAPAQVAVVEIAARDSYTVTFRVVERLTHELPNEITDTWETEISDVAFPPVGPTRYLATFRHIFHDEGTQRNSGILTDFRPYAGDTPAVAAQALAAPIPGFNAAALEGADADYQMAWTVHRAPSVVATRIGGAAYECCTGAGGTYFSHDVTHDFSSSGVSRLLLGGHGYYSEERCGERQLLALNAAGALPYAEPEGGLGCGEPVSWPNTLDSYLPTAEVHVQVPDSVAARSKFDAWIQAPDPVYLLRSESELADPAPLSERAFWSQPMSLEQLLVSAEMIWIQVVSVSTRGDTRDVLLETTFSTSDAVPRRRVRLSAKCIDPRLLREGSTWLAPVSINQATRIENTERAGVFLVPGWLFPAQSAVASRAGYLASQLMSRGN
jgi:hypothetical protein